MKALVLGIGRMGTAISWSMDKLGFEVFGMDTWVGAETNMPEGTTFIHVENVEKIFEWVVNNGHPDVVISSLPYHQTEEVGTWCVDNGVRYCDLGGRVDVSKNINEWALKKARKPVFTDLGLAPGWVNILAEQGCKEIHRQADEVEMMVGGIPGIPMNPPLNYSVTWSTDGLINEYEDSCEVLHNGEIHMVPGMEGLEKVYFDLIHEDMEAFFTSGGASHTIKSMKERGVKNCSYKTLRWPGHCEAVKFLIRKCDLSKECLLDIFKNGCVDDGNDIVLIRSIVRGGDVEWKKEKIISADNDGRFSAMQKATAFPISSIASLMATGYFDNRVQQNRSGDIKLPIVLSYKDIPFDDFNEYLEKLLSY
jgi:saccharopine dehydrogenase-like NADP-dependent oxidoreductase